MVKRRRTPVSSKEWGAFKRHRRGLGVSDRKAALRACQECGHSEPELGRCFERVRKKLQREQKAGRIVRPGLKVSAAGRPLLEFQRRLLVGDLARTAPADLVHEGLRLIIAEAKLVEAGELKPETWIARAEALILRAEETYGSGRDGAVFRTTIVARLGKLLRAFRVK